MARFPTKLRRSDKPIYGGAGRSKAATRRIKHGGGMCSGKTACVVRGCNDPIRCTRRPGHIGEHRFESHAQQHIGSR